MSIFEVQGGRVTHQYLMNKSKSEIAYLALDYLDEIERIQRENEALRAERDSLSRAEPEGER